jgi:peptidoglycan/LPS O-acetylase OafA/YrhL
VPLVNRRNAWITAVIADVVAVLVFVLIGRANHHESDRAHGVWHTAWPFLLGTALGLALVAVRKADPRTVRSGISVWLWTLVIGMVVRHSIGGGTPIDFVIVAALVLALFFLGWRAWVTGRRWRSRWRAFKG